MQFIILSTTPAIIVIIKKMGLVRMAGKIKARLIQIIVISGRMKVESPSPSTKAIMVLRITIMAIIMVDDIIMPLE